jgi:hypothetical protein
LTDELYNMDISRRGWRLTEDAVEEKVKELAELVATTTTVVYQLFDNMCFLVKKADGSDTYPRRGRTRNTM